MKVLETYYRERWFRSRLEARYAVFFDALGEVWDYETEGYNLDDGDLYLPDFWLPRLEAFVEIKGSAPTGSEIRKCRKLQFYTENDVLICSGSPLENAVMWFSWEDTNGGLFTESAAQWIVTDSGLDMSEYISEPDSFLRIAAIRAKRARFEFGETPSQELASIVDYNRIAF